MISAEKWAACYVLQGEVVADSRGWGMLPPPTQPIQGDRGMSEELRMAEHQVELDAIMSLCHHHDGPFRPWCEACVFRQQVAIEHLQRVCAETVACLSGVHASCPCVDGGLSSAGAGE